MIDLRLKEVPAVDKYDIDYPTRQLVFIGTKPASKTVRAIPMKKLHEFAN